MGKQVILGVQIETENLALWVENNHELIGCTQAYYVRHSQEKF